MHTVLARTPVCCRHSFSLRMLRRTDARCNGTDWPRHGSKGSVPLLLRVSGVRSCLMRAHDPRSHRSTARLRCILNRLCLFRLTGGSTVVGHVQATCSCHHSCLTCPEGQGFEMAFHGGSVAEMVLRAWTRSTMMPSVFVSAPTKLRDFISPDRRINDVFRPPDTGRCVDDWSMLHHCSCRWMPFRCLGRCN